MWRIGVDSDNGRGDLVCVCSVGEVCLREVVGGWLLEVEGRLGLTRSLHSFAISDSRTGSQWLGPTHLGQGPKFRNVRCGLRGTHLQNKDFGGWVRRAGGWGGRVSE